MQQMKGRIHHVGVAVAELASAREFLEGVMGFRLENAGSLTDSNLEFAFFSLDGGSQVEMFQVNDPEMRARRLGEGNQARVEHIAIEVEDIDQARAELEASGVRMQAETPMLTPVARSYFTRPETSGGVIYQLLDRKIQPAS